MQYGWFQMRGITIWIGLVGNCNLLSLFSESVLILSVQNFCLLVPIPRARVPSLVTYIQNCISVYILSNVELSINKTRRQELLDLGGMSAQSNIGNDECIQQSNNTPPTISHREGSSKRNAVNIEQSEDDSCDSSGKSEVLQCNTRQGRLQDSLEPQ